MRFPYAMVLIAALGWACAAGGCGGPHGREFADLNSLIILPDSDEPRDVNAWKERAGSRPLRIGVARFNGNRFRSYGAPRHDQPPALFHEVDTHAMVDALGGRSKRELEFHVQPISPPEVEEPISEHTSTLPADFWSLARASDVDLVLLYTIKERHNTTLGTILLSLFTLGLFPEMSANEDRALDARLHDLSGAAPLFQTASEFQASHIANAWTLGLAFDHASSRASSRVHKEVTEAIVEWLRAQLTTPTTEPVTWPADV